MFWVYVIISVVCTVLVILIGMFMDTEEVPEGEKQIIRCPECGKEQEAYVKFGIPFDYYIHQCESCGYIITESEWEEVA